MKFRAWAMLVLPPGQVFTWPSGFQQQWAFFTGASVDGHAFLSANPNPDENEEILELDVRKNEDIVVYKPEDKTQAWKLILGASK